MTILDLPFLVVVAGWLYRRVTRPPVPTDPVIVQKPLQEYLHVVRLCFKMLENRNSEKHIKSGLIAYLCYWYIDRYMDRQHGIYMAIHNAGVDEVVMIKKGDTK